MLWWSVWVVAMVFAVLISLWGERYQNRVLGGAGKTVASLLFVLLGGLRWQAGDGFATWLLVGLVLALLGDVLLLGEGTFDAGLGAFLLAHLAYALAFHQALAIARWPFEVLLPMAVIAAAAILWLWPRLGRQKLPVTLYLVAITVMGWGALAATLAQAVLWTAAPGAVLFLISDLTVARNRFVQPGFINRALGRPLYYLGQVLLALTITP